MKYLLPPSLLASLLLFVSFMPGEKTDLSQAASPLAVFSSEWNNTGYLKCNTAGNTGYMSASEKEVIYILNLLRTNPKLFANSVVQKYPEYIKNTFLHNKPEYKSLLDTLGKLKPLPLLYPDSLSYASALCHAVSSGKDGYTGHDRRTKDCKEKEHFYGECCDYGHKEPLVILMSFLVDEYVPSAAHRFICLSSFQKIGISIQPHNSYGYNAVLDFY